MCFCNFLISVEPLTATERLKAPSAKYLCRSCCKRYTMRDDSGRGVGAVVCAVQNVQWKENSADVWMILRQHWAPHSVARYSLGAFHDRPPLQHPLTHAPHGEETKFGESHPSQLQVCTGVWRTGELLWATLHRWHEPQFKFLANCDTRDHLIQIKLLLTWIFVAKQIESTIMIGINYFDNSYHWSVELECQSHEWLHTKMFVSSIDWLVCYCCMCWTKKKDNYYNGLEM